jgi:signal transduction histidine kinase
MATKRLLLVDDEPGHLASLAGALRTLVDELVEAGDGKSALAAFSACHPDLVVLDASMPGMDGLEVLECIRAQAGEEVPVILLTARPGCECRLRALESGADDCLEKPPDLALLRARVRALLHQKESRDALQASIERQAERSAMLERLQRAQGELAAFLVHDLKNPLAAIWSNLEFLQEQLPEPGGLREVVGEAIDSSKRLRSMIDDLLIVSRMEESEFPVHLESVPIADVLAEVFRQYDRRAEEKRVKLLKPQTIKGHVRSDRALLQRVIENILDNSLRHTPANGRVGVATRVDGCVEIAVSNSGPAIPPADRERIFDKFARLEPSAALQGARGLGLYFCKRAVESLGGRISVTESDDWPTSFVVRLPQAVRAA